MTVCIGAICQDGNMAIVASDRMVTCSFPPVGFEHTKQKIFPLTEYSVALTAGNALKAIEVIPRIREALGKKPDIESIVQRGKQLYQILRSDEAEELLLKPRTITKEVFYTRGISVFPPDLFSMIDHEFVRYDYGLELLLVGVDSQGAHIYSIRNPGVSDCFDTLGFTAIGVGYLHAAQVFIAHGYRTSYHVEEAINIVYAAKKAAEVAPGVGTETDISIIGIEGVISVDPQIISELSKIHDEVRKPPVEEMREKSKRLKDLIENRIKNKEGTKATQDEQSAEKGGSDVVVVKDEAEKGERKQNEETNKGRKKETTG